MTSAAMCAETREGRRATDHGIGKAFLTAHLLTANRKQAENAVLEAILHWDLDQGTEEAFLHRVAHAAIRAQDECESSGADCLPLELQAVLDLSPRQRRCFVLRVLVGLSRQACARLLHLDIFHVDRYTCEALKYLPQRCDPADSQLELLGIQRFRVEEKHAIA